MTLVIAFWIIPAAALAAAWVLKCFNTAAEGTGK